jgi:hypothetical protein
MARFTKLLQELKFMPDDAPRVLAPGEDSSVGAAERFKKSLARGEFARVSADNLAKGRKAVAALPRIRAEAKAFKANMTDMIKSIQTGQAATAEQFAKAHAISDHKATLARFTAWNERFGASVRKGEMTAEQASQLEARAHQRAAALVEQGRRLGVK